MEMVNLVLATNLSPRAKLMRPERPGREGHSRPFEAIQ